MCNTIIYEKYGCSESSERRFYYITIYLKALLQKVTIYLTVVVPDIVYLTVFDAKCHSIPDSTASKY
jgi:hypothetical protein